MPEPENWLTIRERHYEQHLGPLKAPVMHSTDDTQPHIDIYQFGPSAERDYWTLITGGMSNCRQFVPDEAPEQIARRAELLMYVHEPKPWMFSVLKNLAEYPFQEETFLHWWHTLPYGRMGDSESCLLSGFLLLPPYYENPKTFGTLKIDGDIVDMLWLVPITSDELDYAEEQGSRALDDLITEKELDLVVDEGRPSLV